MTDDLTRAVGLELLRRGEITMAEAAEMAGVSRQAIYKMCQRAGIDPVRARCSLVERRTVQVTRVLAGKPYQAPMSKRQRRAMAIRLVEEKAGG
jgi:hypothetical protein